MSAPPPWSGWYLPRRQGVPRGDLRVSDAERAEVADILSRNFSEGRLDQSEFDERLQKAMAAKTRSDFAGLLGDLPAPVPPPPPASQLRRHRGRLGLLFVAVFLFAVAASMPVWPAHFPWLLLALVFFLLWSTTHRRRRWRGDAGDRW